MPLIENIIDTVHVSGTEPKTVNKARPSVDAHTVDTTQDLNKSLAVTSKHASSHISCDCVVTRVLYCVATNVCLRPRYPLQDNLKKPNTIEHTDNTDRFEVYDAPAATAATLDMRGARQSTPLLKKTVASTSTRPAAL